MIDPHQRNLGLAAGAVLATTSTLVCCVLPAVLVALGAGSVLVGLLAAVPQLVWLSEHKAMVFGFAGGCLVASGLALWNARHLPCPVDAEVAALCDARRRVSLRLFAVALALLLVGALFAFVLPRT
jgi:hypothetical protein